MRLRASPWLIWWALFPSWLWLGTVLATDFPLLWRWSNPTPHGNNIIDMADANGLAIHVCERGQIYTSDDLALWVPQESRTTNSLRAVAFFGSKILVSGERGTILYADSVSNFTPVDLGTEDWLEGLAVSSNLVVAVGDNGAVYTSSDGISWQRHPQSFNTWLRSAAYGGGVFVAVGETGFIATSSDGSRWQTRSSGTTVDLNKVVWAVDHFWAVGDGGKTLTSSSGVTWQSVKTGATNTLFTAAGNDGFRVVAGDYEVRTRDKSLLWSNELDASKSSSAPPWTYYSAVYDGAGFLLGGRTGMLIEGTTNVTGRFSWLTYSDPIRNWLWDVTRTPDFYVAVGDRATVMTSEDGLDWSLEGVPDSVTNSIFLGVGGTTNLLVAVGNQGAIITSPNVLTNLVVTNTIGTNLVVTNESVSTFGLLWNAVEPRPTANDLQGVAAFGDLLIVTGDNGIVLTSHDGLHWLQPATPTSALLSSVCSYPGGLVAVGKNGTILTSPDAFFWSSQISGTTNWIYRVRYLGGRLIAVGQNGAILTSDDGITWWTQQSGTAHWLNDVSFVDKTYFIVGTQGTILASADTINWTNIGTITEKSLFGGAVNNGQFVTVGVEGIILNSQVTPPILPGLLAVAPDLGLTFAGFSGGPFNSAPAFVLTNGGRGPLSWSATHTQDWCQLSSTNGTLTPGMTASVQVTLSTGANLLPVGTNTDRIAFTNITDGNGSTARSLSLLIYPPSGLKIVQASPDPQYQLTLTSVPGWTCFIEKSIDLINWTRVSTNIVPADGTFQWMDSGSAYPEQRFYRGMTSP